MTWIHGLKSSVCHFLAIRRRESVRLRTASVLDRSDDRLLAGIGVARSRVADYAREVAHTAVPAAPMKSIGRKGMLARLKTWRDKRVAIRELSLLDDRLLRDIGIEPGWVDDAVVAALRKRDDHAANQPAAELSEAMQESPVRAHHQPPVPATTCANPRAPMRSGDRATIRADRAPDAHALQARAANRYGSPKRRRAAAGM